MDPRIPKEAGDRLLDEALTAAGLVRSPVPAAATTPTLEGLQVGVESHRAVALLATDDRGAVTFHLPQRSDTEDLVPDLRSTVHFLVPETRLRDLGPSTENIDIATSVPILHLIETVAGSEIGDTFAAAYRERERRSRPHRIRHVDTRDGNFVAGDDVADLSTLTGKHVLMFVHGIFSTSGDTFHGLDATTVTELSARYAATICFDHPTVSVSPEDNVAWFLQHLPATDVRFDIIAHSRGGLVSRLLAGQADAVLTESDRALRKARNPQVRRIAFVGTPNHGSAIVDAEKWGHLVDRLATMVKLFGGALGAPGRFLAELLEVLKAASVEAAVDLPGLSSMVPGSPLMTALATGATTLPPSYHLIDSDYTPARFLHHLFHLKQDLIDGVEVLVDHAVFDRAGNDVAVPMSSVGDGAGPGFPIDDRDGHRFTPADDVWHCSYFGHPTTRRCLTTWFTGADGPTAAGP